MFFLTSEVWHVRSLEESLKNNQSFSFSNGGKEHEHAKFPPKSNCLWGCFRLLISFVDLENSGTDYISLDLKETTQEASERLQ